MTDTHDGEWHYLEAEIDGQRQTYALDTSRLSGGEAELIEDRTGMSISAWGQRVKSQRWAKDLNVMLFIAASREQARKFGRSELDYHAFVDRIELTSVRELDGPPLSDDHDSSGSEGGDTASDEPADRAPRRPRSTSSRRKASTA